MSTDKPDVIADPVETDSTSETEAIRQRIAEGIEQQKTGDELVNSIKNPEVAKQSGGTTDVVTQVGSSNDSSNADTAALKLIEASTGRKFDNVEEAKKFLSNLNSMVGDQSVAKAREAEKILNDISQKFGKNATELEKFMTDLVISRTDVQEPTKDTKPSHKEESGSELVKRLEKLENADQTQRLLAKYPIASEVSDEVAIIAKSKGISYVEAFENSPLKSLVETKAKEEQTKNPIVTPSNRTNIDYQRAQALGKKAMDGQASEADLQELVATVLNLKK